MEFNAWEGNDWFIAFFLGLPSHFPHLTSQYIYFSEPYIQERRDSDFKGGNNLSQPYVWDGGGIGRAVEEEKTEEDLKNEMQSENSKTQNQLNEYPQICCNLLLLSFFELIHN